MSWTDGMSTSPCTVTSVVTFSMTTRTPSIAC
jgi:hypothetical protein